MICNKYIELYLSWVNADLASREAALLKLQQHHFYCSTCQARQKELTDQAARANHPEIEND